MLNARTVFLLASSSLFFAAVLLGLGCVSVAAQDGQCGLVVWSQDFDNLDIAKTITEQNGIAFPPVANLPGYEFCVKLMPGAGRLVPVPIP